MAIHITNASGFSSSSVSNNSSGQIVNLGLKASVSGNALTVTLTQADGTSAPTSGTGAVIIGFRNPSTGTTGLYNLRSATSTRVALTNTSGDTLGLASSPNVQYIWVYAYDDSGTVRVALAGSRSFDEGLRYTVSSLGGTATSPTTLYAAVGVSNTPIRLIGRIAIVVTTAGVYDATPSDISLNQYDYVQAPGYYSGYMGVSSSWSTSSTSFSDGTNAGGNALTQRFSTGITVTAGASNVAGITFTPTSPTAAYRVSAQFPCYNTLATTTSIYQLIDSNSNILTSHGMQQGSVATAVFPMTLSGISIAGSTSPLTVKIQLLTFNGGASATIAPINGSVATIEWVVQQIGF